jgi:hypothetical protein
VYISIEKIVTDGAVLTLHSTACDIEYSNCKTHLLMQTLLAYLVDKDRIKQTCTYRVKKGSTYEYRGQNMEHIIH